MRPDRWFWFGDSYLYAHHYNNIALASNQMEFNAHAEWFFDGMESMCKGLGFDVHVFFTLVAAFYIILMFMACQMLLWENTWMAMLFFLTSFSFYQFGVNGIRTGMATSLMLVGFAFLSKRKVASTMIAALIFLLAMGTHRSMTLPVAMTVAAYFVVVDS